MRDSHVERLHFAIGAEEGVSYEAPIPLTFENYLGDFDCRDGRLVVKPVAHFSDENDARTVIEPFLRAWEIDSDLNGNIGTIRFKFMRADVIDRDPPPPGTSKAISLKARSVTASRTTATLQIVRRSYPSPPESFRATSEAVQAYSRWRAFRDGREPLQSMAYFFLTLAEATAGGRRRAAHVLAIKAEVLSTIGRLASTKGDLSTARKVARTGAFDELTDSEKRWLEQAIRHVIKRLGERVAGTAMESLKITNLPKIK